jgi:type II secretory pathway component PulF
MSSQYAMIYHNLAVLLDAGVPILKSLNIISEGQKGRMKIIFFRLNQSVSKGNTIAESMAEHPKAFPKLDLMLIKSAELSAELPNCLKMLSNWHEFTTRLKRIIITGCIYPLAILHIALFIILAISLILGEISASEYLIRIATTLGVIYLLIAIPLILYRSIPNTGVFRRILDDLILRIPILGHGIRELSICRYFKGFNMLYKAGIPIAQCAAQATELTGNSIIADIFRGGAVSIEAGNTMYEGFSRKFPLDYLNIWKTGERTGELDKMSAKIAEISGDKADLLLTEFARWLPKLLYFLILVFLAIQILRLAGAIQSSYIVNP